MKKTWSKIRKGDVLDLGGREWTVEKIKPGKKKAEVKIRHKSNVVRDTVKLADKVRIAERSAPAAPRKAEKPAPPKKMPKKPPQPAHGDPWETQQDRIEKKLDEILGAKLVGESIDGERTYYVPPVDVTTVAAHLLIFHGGVDAHEDAAGMLHRHAAEHAAAERGETTLAMVHWHTEQRPTTGKKKSKK